MSNELKTRFDDLIQKYNALSGGPEMILVRDELRKLMAESGDKIGKRVYLRYGALPASGMSRNSRENTMEAGVSVYDSWLIDGKVYSSIGEKANYSFSFFWTSPAYLVTGVPVEVTGGDGETLLIGCKARKIKADSEVWI